MQSSPETPGGDRAPAGHPDVGDFRYARFSTKLPDLDANGRETGTHQVVIAGGGPVGMALALGLARHGVRSVILEADDSVCVGSRAICISRRSLHIVERLGAAKDFLAKALPWSIGRSFYKADEVFRFEMPVDAREKFPPMVNLQQYYIEQYLLDAIHRFNRAMPGTIDMRWNSELVGFEEDGEVVTLQVRTPLGGYSVRADWLAACDGGQSFVRKSLGLELEGAAYEGRYAIVDIELESDYPTERRAWFDPQWHRGSTVLMHKQPDNIWRIDYQLPRHASAEDSLEPAAVEAFVQRHLDAIGEGDRPWRPVWKSIYRAGAMTLKNYRVGRVLFAGNAAHAMPIFGVRGLNSGFDDADNLAWKLASVLDGISDDSLLDSYSRERIQAFRVNAENAMRSTEFMSPPSRGFDLLREAALSLAKTNPLTIAKLVNPRQTQAVLYDASDLSTPDDQTYEAGPQPGELMPDIRLDTGHLSDLLQRGFNLVEFRSQSDGTGAPDRLEGAFDPIHVTHILITAAGMSGGDAIADEVALSMIGDGRGAIYLLRPDDHVAARWSTLNPAAVHAALRRATCRKEAS